MFWDDDLRGELRQRRLADIERRPAVVESGIGPHARVGGRRVLVFGSNDYLGLATHPSVLEAASRAVRRYGAGVGGSRYTVGNAALNIELEAELTGFTGHAGAIVFPSGYAANAGTIPALTGKQDLILSDDLNHASLIDGCRLSAAEKRIYQHGDPDFVHFALRKDRGSFRRVLIVTNGVFGMDGDIAPLAELCRLAEEHACGILVDDAHAVGVLGEHGRGTADHHGLLGHPALIQIGTFSKALGSIGGFATGSEPVVDTIRQNARTYGYSTGLPPASLAAAWQALRLLQEDRTLLTRLRDNTGKMRDELRRSGFRALRTETPVVPIMIGAADDAKRFAERCFELGLYAPAIRPPSVPPGTSRIRLSVSSAHTTDDIERAARILAQAASATELVLAG